LYRGGITRRSGASGPWYHGEKQNEDLLHNMLQLSKQMVAVSDDNGTGRLFADGKNSAEIARTLGISLQTLRNHLHHINEKLGTHRRLHTVMHAMRRKLWYAVHGGRARFKVRRKSMVSPFPSQNAQDNHCLQGTQRSVDPPQRWEGLLDAELRRLSADLAQGFVVLGQFWTHVSAC
jgi:hypothetical protein